VSSKDPAHKKLFFSGENYL